MNYFEEIRNIKLHKKDGIRALNKPLLLLYTLSQVKSGKPNKFYYDDVEQEIGNLISRFGTKNCFHHFMLSSLKKTSLILI